MIYKIEKGIDAVLRSWCRSCVDLQIFNENNNDKEGSDRNVHKIEEVSSEILTMPSSFNYLSPIVPMPVLIVQPPSLLPSHNKINNNANIELAEDLEGNKRHSHKVEQERS